MRKRIMPGRTKKEQAKLTQRQEKIYTFLRDHYTGVLASVDPNGDPHAAVLYYVMDDQFAVSFVTRTGTKKYDNLVRNDHVILVVFEPDNQTVAQIVGKAVEIKNANRVNDVAGAVFERTLEAGRKDALPITKLGAGEYAAFRIDPDQIRMASFAAPSAQDGRNIGEIFESIESFDLKLV